MIIIQSVYTFTGYGKNKNYKNINIVMRNYWFFRIISSFTFCSVVSGGLDVMLLYGLRCDCTALTYDQNHFGHWISYIGAWYKYNIVLDNLDPRFYNVYIHLLAVFRKSPFLSTYFIVTTEVLANWNFFLLFIFYVSMKYYLK